MTERGVRVRILTNSLRSNNHTTVHAHYKKYRKPMIEAGVELHELRPDPEILERHKQGEKRAAGSRAGLHTKSFVVDRRLSMIGSYNMDPRSRIWNSEIGLLIDSEEFAEKVLEIMETDLDPANSYRVTLDEKGNLVWTAKGPDGPATWHKEPETSRLAWQRFTSRFLRGSSPEWRTVFLSPRRGRHMFSLGREPQEPGGLPMYEPLKGAADILPGA